MEGAGEGISVGSRKDVACGIHGPGMASAINSVHAGPPDLQEWIWVVSVVGFVRWMCNKGKVYFDMNHSLNPTWHSGQHYQDSANSGPDGIPGHVLRACAGQLTEVLTDMTGVPQGFVLSLPTTAHLCMVLIPLSSTGVVHRQHQEVAHCGLREDQSNGTEVGERVASFNFLGVHISKDLPGILNTSTLVKKAHQRLFFLRRSKKVHLSLPQILVNFYSCTIGSILTDCITVWYYGHCSVSDRKALQRVMRTAQRITGSSLPTIDAVQHKPCLRRVRSIARDSSHPGHRLFSLLPSGRRYRSLRFPDQQFRNRFFPAAVHLLDPPNPLNAFFALLIRCTAQHNGEQIKRWVFFNPQSQKTCIKAASIICISVPGLRHALYNGGVKFTHFRCTS
ncbi:hypothetical protein N1851_020676 [Merluccius polli]|uniref:Alkylated DNA repair protein AlkB homologue 8 N-terminal domain-containing protein n=1 Tax=Merluccius polli TaxID=89951 RepID=A0AA47NWT8_MERPO|nr:hypothetical protein N1851_020676 [Merluccius polli]